LAEKPTCFVENHKYPGLQGLGMNIVPKAVLNDNNIVRLGVMPPLTGLVGMYGREICHAAHIACAEINAQGGVLGQRLEIVIEDDGSMPGTAVGAAERLLDKHGCVAIIGNLLSNSRIAVADTVAGPRRIPYLNFSFYEGSIDNRYFFHFAALPNQQIDKMIPWMAGHFGPKMYFAGANYEWPRGSIDAARRILSGAGGEVVGEEYFEIGTSDYQGLMERLARSGADVFVPYAAGTDQINLLNAFHASGLKQRMAVVMGHYDEVMVASLAQEVREGLYSSNTYFMSIDTPENRAYLQSLAKLPDVTGIWPQGNGVLTNFGEGTYVCVHAFARAAEQAGSFNAEELVEALARVCVDAPQGQVVMDPKTRHARVNTWLACCQRDGSFKIIRSFGQIPPGIPQRYHFQTGANDNDRVQPPVIMSDWEMLGTLPVDIHLTAGQTAPVLLPREKKAHSDFLTNLTKFVMADRELRAALSGQDKEQDVDFVFHGTSVTVRSTPLYMDGVCSHFALHAKTGNPGLYAPDSGSMQRRDEQLHESILKAVDIAVIAVNESLTLMQVNAPACEMFGYTPEQMQGMPLSQLLPPHLRDKHEEFMRGFFAGNDTMRQMGSRAELTGYRSDGTFFPLEVSIAKCRANDRSIVVATVRDISRLRDAQAELVRNATHDPLTKLPNRVLMNDRINSALGRSGRTGKSVALMFVDLDEFKLINDTYGHDVGDQLLAAIGNELLQIVRPGDTVARFGGDEFVVMCDQLTDWSVVTRLAERVVDRLKHPITVGGNEFYATVSIGVAIGHGLTHTADELLRNADAAMYKAKERGRDGWMIFSDEMGENARRQLKIATGLRNAVKNAELYAVLQPIVNSETGRIVGAETLLRWEKDGEEISPGHFIPVAEMTGSILAIGEWVFQEACRIQSEWRRILPDNNVPYITVNLSARQLNEPQLVQRFARHIAQTGAEPRRIVLEITESTLMKDVEHTIGVLNELGCLGLSLAVDDFGTGYSSLSHLKRLPVDTLKVDRIFVENIDHQADTCLITTAIINMAHSLNLKVTAEGVETRAEIDKLRTLGCDTVQGYFFYKPMQVMELNRLLLGESTLRTTYN